MVPTPAAAVLKNGGRSVRQVLLISRMLTAVTTNEGYTRYQYRRDASDTQANRSYGYSLVGYEMTIGIEYDAALGTSGFGVIRTLKDGAQRLMPSEP
jgi:hypothetical protein